MGSGASQKEITGKAGEKDPITIVTVSPPPSPPSPPEPQPAFLSRPLPTILITAPSQEDLYASPATVTIADAVKEKRPQFTPFIVGNKLVTSGE